MLGPVCNINTRRIIRRRRLNVHRRVFILPFYPSVYSSYIFSASLAGMVVSSVLSKHPSNGSSSFQRILQTSPFIHFPLRAQRRQPRVDECRTRTHYLTYYVIIPFFRVAILASFQLAGSRTRSIVNRDRSRSIRE